MIQGFILEYSYRDRKSLALLNHKLYGRLSRQKQNGHSYCYYLKGMLHNTKFKKIKRGKIFLLDDRCLDRITLDVLTSNYKIYKVETDISKNELYTGLEYWKKHAKEKEVKVDGWGGRPSKNTTKNESRRTWSSEPIVRRDEKTLVHCN